jgi:hypothetical protein
MFWYAIRFGRGKNELVMPDVAEDIPPFADIPHRSLHHAIHAVTHSFHRDRNDGDWSLWPGSSFGYYLQWHSRYLNLHAQWVLVPVMTHADKLALDEYGIRTGPIDPPKDVSVTVLGKGRILEPGDPDY